MTLSSKVNAQVSHGKQIFRLLSALLFCYAYIYFHTENFTYQRSWKSRLKKFNILFAHTKQYAGNSKKKYHRLRSALAGSHKPSLTSVGSRLFSLFFFTFSGEKRHAGNVFFIKIADDCGPSAANTSYGRVKNYRPFRPPALFGHINRRSRELARRIDPAGAARLGCVTRGPTHGPRPEHPGLQIS